MNTEGLFYAFSRYDVRGCLIEPASVDPYLQRSAIQGGPNARLDIGPLWQGLMAVLPEIADGVATEGTPAFHCWIWPSDRVVDGAQRLDAVPASVLGQRVQDWQATADAAATLGFDRLEVLRQLVRWQAEVRSFWLAAAQRRDAVLLYVV